MEFNTPVVVATPQLQSPLIQLPAEIKNLIFDYCFVADGPIVDPAVDCSKKGSEVSQAPKIGMSILRTCRRAYLEADRRPLFARNSFCFTKVDRIHRFLKSVGQVYASCVRDVEVDGRGAQLDQPTHSQDWLNYLSNGGGLWGKLQGSLRCDAPGLRVLRLNFESWPTIPVARAQLWTLIRGMLLYVRGLQRVMVIGASRGGGMAKRNPWSPVHFVGGDDVGPDDLAEHMWATVDGFDDQEKVIRWERRTGRLHLEVVSMAHLRYVDPQWPGPVSQPRCSDPWPENGSCTWSAYQARNAELVEQKTKEINPSVFE